MPQAGQKFVHQSPSAVAKTTLISEKWRKMELSEKYVNCKLRDSKRSVDLLKYFKFAKKANLDFAQKCCIFAVRKGRPRGFPFFMPQKWQKQPQRLLKQGPMLLKLPPMLFSVSPMS